MSEDGGSNEQAGETDSGAAGRSGPTRPTGADTSGERFESEAEGAGTDEMEAEDESWRFSLDDLPGENDGTEGTGEGVAGSWVPGDDIEPQEIDLENALFVTLGVVLALVILYLMVF